MGSFEAVYRRTLPSVERVARRNGVAQPDLDDAVQDTFLTVYRRWSQLHHDDDPCAWVRGIAIRTCWNYRRARRRRGRWLEERRDVLDQCSDTRAGADEHFAIHEGERWLAKALLRLDERKREAVVLTQIEQRSAMEVSRLTGLSPNTVASRLRAALAELRRDGEADARRR